MRGAGLQLLQLYLLLLEHFFSLLRRHGGFEIVECVLVVAVVEHLIGFGQLHLAGFGLVHAGSPNHPMQFLMQANPQMLSSILTNPYPYSPQFPTLIMNNQVATLNSSTVNQHLTHST